MTRKLLDTPNARRALALLDEAYRTRPRRPGRTPQHPIEVAELLLADGQPATIILTGLLHDVLEDTQVTAQELRHGFGPDISRSVQALTEDASIGKYQRRKASLRRQILGSSPETATVSLADKIAKLRSSDTPPRARKLEHYQATLDEVEQRYGHSRLSRQLRRELARWP